MYMHVCTHTQVGHIAWHPSAANILASVSFDHKIIIWNTSTGDQAFTLDGMHPDIIYSISWSYNGSLIATTCKDKKIRVINPREKQVVAVSTSRDQVCLLFFFFWGGGGGGQREQFDPPEKGFVPL